MVAVFDVSCFIAFLLASESFWQCAVMALGVIPAWGLEQIARYSACCFAGDSALHAFGQNLSVQELCGLIFFCFSIAMAPSILNKSKVKHGSAYLTRISSPPTEPQNKDISRLFF